MRHLTPEDVANLVTFLMWFSFGFLFACMMSKVVGC